ncbi:MAG: S4 domain-containing protein [Candidatus Eisenbacteria bacterium]
MRLDRFLKLSRLIKQRSVAKWACDAGRVSILGRKAKAGTVIKVGDELTISLRDRTLRVSVLEVPSGNVSKEKARALCEIIEDLHASDS